jgi:hypothetical protein
LLVCFVFFVINLLLARSITFEKLESRIYLFHGESAQWKTLHSVPHDLGDPGKLFLIVLNIQEKEISI